MAIQPSSSRLPKTPTVRASSSSSLSPKRSRHNDATTRKATTISNSSSSSISRAKVNQPQHLSTKSVTFHQIVRVNPILHLREYSDLERDACWYAIDEIARTKAELKEVLRDMRDNGRSTRKQNFCTRGLENGLLLNHHEKHWRRKASIRKVLDEQDAQVSRALARLHPEDDGDDLEIVLDATRLRRAYKVHSRAARNKALAIGRVDEITAGLGRMNLVQAIAGRLNQRPRAAAPDPPASPLSSSITSTSSASSLSSTKTARPIAKRGTKKSTKGNSSSSSSHSRNTMDRDMVPPNSTTTMVPTTE